MLIPSSDTIMTEPNETNGARVPRDPAVLEEFYRIVSPSLKVNGVRGKPINREKLKLAFKIIWEHGPMTANRINKLGDCYWLHTYLDKIAQAGWIKRLGKASSGELGRAKSHLWEITGEIGTNVADKAGWKAKEPKKIFEDKPGRKLWPDIVEMLKQYYSPKLGGVDESTARSLLQCIEIEVDITRETINNKMSSTLQNSNNSPSRQKFLTACKTLGVDPPRAGKPLKIEDVRRKMRKLARAYHPDVNAGGSDNFRKTIDSFNVIEAFITQTEKT
jgi:hypothetical protein